MALRSIGLLFLPIFLTVIVTGQEPPPPFNGSCVTGNYPPDESRRVSGYVINLDLPPIQRWKQVAMEKKAQIKGILDKFISFLDEFGSWAEEIVYILKLTGPMLDDMLPQPYADEIKGISEATGLEVGEVVFYNIFYEIFTVCTSVVAQDPSGKLYHARNLDFGLFMGWDPKNRTWEITTVLRPAIINLDWQSKGKTVFKSVHFAGYIGILTGISPGKFTLTMNERFKLDGGYIGILEWLKDGKKAGSWMGFLTRKTMETAQSYQEAQYMLAKTRMLAPAYFILGGNSSGQACVITRDREVNTTDIWHMKDPGAGQWYILETNYDHDKAPLFLDDRRTPANICMRNMTQQNVGFAGIFGVLSSKPVLNKLTTYAALMQVNSGHLETWLQYCKDPCIPW